MNLLPVTSVFAGKGIMYRRIGGGKMVMRYATLEMDFFMLKWYLMAMVAGVLMLCGGVMAAEGTYQPEPNYVPTRNLSRFFAKLREGKPVVVLSIGGSVTEGRSWAALSAEWLRQQFPGKQISYIDGAYGGTPPWQTVFRLRRDILPHHPDLVFIEYAVNSYDPMPRCWLAEDGIIQQLLRQPQRPEIVFVYVGGKNGNRNLETVQPVARHYGFPEVDVRAHMQTKIDAGGVKWEDLAKDGIHPNPQGHAIYAEAVIAFLQQEMARKEITPAPAVPAPFKGAELTTATLLPIAALKASPEWQTIAPPEGTARFFDEMFATTQAGATMTVTANTTVLGLYLIQTFDSGQIEWTVDGGAPKTLDLWMPWLGHKPDDRYVRNFILAEGLPRGEHTLTVKVLPKSGKAEGNWVRIGGVCVTNPQP